MEKKGVLHVYRWILDARKSDYALVLSLSLTSSEALNCYVKVSQGSDSVLILFSDHPRQPSQCRDVGIFLTITACIHPSIRRSADADMSYDRRCHYFFIKVKDSSMDIN